MKKVCIIQARMGSTRLPGKILKEIDGKPLLEYQIERLKKCKLIDELIIATTTNEEDNQIEGFCLKNNIQSYRGSEQDVLARYYGAAREFNADIIIRITSDCPIIDPDVVDEVIENYENSHFDYVSNTLERTYPRGMDTEVFSFKVLEKAFNNAKEQYEREHVTPYFYNNPSKFKLGNVFYTSDESYHRWTVDTEEDYALIRNIIRELNSPQNVFTLKDILSLLRDYPEWVKINAHIEQKKLGE